MLASNVERWLWWDWIDRNTDLIWSSLREHVILVVLSVGIGLAIALPLGVAASRWRRLYAPTLAVTGVLFTIPSLAAFSFLIPYTGLSRTTALIPLLVARTRKRRCSTARSRASARWIHGSCESPNQASLARVTRRCGADSRTMRRTRSGRTAS